MRGVRTAYFGDTKDTRLKIYLLVWFMSLKYLNGTCSLVYRYLRDTTLAAPFRLNRFCVNLAERRQTAMEPWYLFDAELSLQT